jgi:hypothetical protein
MKLLILIGSLAIPLAMTVLKRKWPKISFYLNLFAVISALVFGNIAAFAIYEIIKDKTVFMTNVHGVFLNPLFLLTGAYLGVYLIYVLISRSFLEAERDPHP